MAGERLPRHVLLVDCRDEKGLIHKITGVLFRRGLNIVRNGEFVDAARGRFYMRTEFEGGGGLAQLEGEVAAVLAPGARVRLRPLRRKRIAVLATREYHCLGDLLMRHAHGDLDARIAAVLSNRQVLGGLADQFGVPFHFLPHAGIGRRQHERQIEQVLGQYELDYLVLAKYMRILSPDFVRAFPHRIINIHHSFLPAFIGANPYRQAFERGVKIIGATAHFVTDDLDEGPIIAQSVMPVDHTHGAGDMARAGRDMEKIVLARALQLVFEERVVVVGNRTIIFD